MQKIGIIIADEHEIVNFPGTLTNTKKVNQFTFKIYNDNIIIVHSGIGIANGASATQELISTFKVNQIWNYGAVGASSELKLYDVIVPAKIYYHDVITPWNPRGQSPNELPYFENDLALEVKAKNHNLASGSSFIATKKQAKAIKEDLDVDIFDMETAAIAQIAVKNNIKLLVIKAVSDIIGISKVENETINFQINRAGQKAFAFMIETLLNRKILKAKEKEKRDV